MTDLEDLYEIVSNKEANIEEITTRIITEGGKLFRKEITPGIPTPIKRMTRLIGGWRNTELICNRSFKRQVRIAYHAGSIPAPGTIT